MLPADHLVVSTALDAGLPLLFGSQSPQEHPDIQRRQYLLYVRVIREDRMEQSRAFLGTESVIDHSFTVARRFPRWCDFLTGVERRKNEIPTVIPENGPLGTSGHRYGDWRA